MEPRSKKFLIWGLVIAIVIVLVFVLTNERSDAAASDEPCTQVITVIDEEAWTEEVVHPEVTHVVHHDAVTHEETVIDQEAVPAVWANWEPRDTHGPQDYTPIWPSDERGHWTLHTQGIPPGHEGPDGVYQQGQGNSPWFYRHAGVDAVTHVVVVVDEEAYDETVVDEEEWTEYIEHPAVTHEETEEVPCEQPDPLVTETSSSSYECDDNFETVVTVVTTTEYVLEGTEWVLGEPVEETTTSQNPVDVVECDVPEEPQEPNTPVVNNPPAPKSVPTVIDAGL